jgi:hypothetical protein
LLPLGGTVFANIHVFRFDAATSAVGDKVDQHGHESKAKVHKEAAKQ